MQNSVNEKSTCSRAHACKEKQYYYEVESAAASSLMI